MHMAVSDLRNGDRQVAHQEGQKDGEHHLGDAPLVAARLGLPVVLDCGPLVAAVEGPGAGVLGALVLAHSLF